MHEAGPPNLPACARRPRRHRGQGDLRRRFATPRHGGRAWRRNAPHLARRRRDVRGRPVLPGRSTDSLAPRAGGNSAVSASFAGGIIAAGEGSRLREGGFVMPKPMMPIAGVPLIGTRIRTLQAAPVGPLAMIVNDQERACVEWVRSRFPELDIAFIVKTTRSSLESFGEVIRRHPGGQMLVTTVDAWCAESDFVRFVEAGRRRPRDATVLAVTPLIADEKPLRVVMTADGRIREIGGAAGDLVTAGMYLVPESV